MNVKTIIMRAAKGKQYPVIFEMDALSGEANGTVRWFCTEQCRERAVSRGEVRTPYNLGTSENSAAENICESCGSLVEKV